MHRRFLAKFAIFFGALIMAVGIFNCVIDPYNVWDVYRRVGLNQWTPKADDLDRLIKPIQIIKNKPEVIFLGDSQVLWGINPATYTEITGKSAYNYGIRGASVYELRRSLEHAIAVDESLHDVYLNVNCSMFVQSSYVPHVKVKPGFDEDQIGKKYISSNNIEKTALSWQALLDSIETIKVNRQNKYETNFYTPEGHPNDVSILSYYKDKPNPFYTSFAGDARLGNYDGDLNFDEDAFEELEKMKQICEEADVNLHLISLPVHAIALELFDCSSEAYANYLHRIVGVLPVLDFNGYNQFSQSTLKGNSWEVERNEYFWDTHHMKSYLGDKIIHILAENTQTDFGEFISDTNVDEHLQRLSDDNKKWAQNHPEYVEEVRYYTGFSPVVPFKLQKSGYVTGKSVVRLAAETGIDRPRFSLARKGAFDIGGDSLTPIEGPKTMYAMLENPEGKRYYTLAETVPHIILAGFMHDKKYEMQGFRIQERLNKVDEGSYALYLLEVAMDGTVYKSDILADVVIRRCD